MLLINQAKPEMIRALSGKLFIQPRDLDGRRQNSDDDDDLPSPTGMIIQLSRRPSSLGPTSVSPEETSPRTTPLQPSSPRSIKSRARSGSVVLRKLERSLSVKSIVSAKRRGSLSARGAKYSSDDHRQSDHEGENLQCSPEKSKKVNEALFSMTDIG